MQMPLDGSAGWRIPDSEKMDMPLDSCAGWRGGVSVAAMGASGARHPRAVVVCGIGGSVEGAAVCRGMGCWVRRGWWSHLGQASPATLAPIACGTVALDRAQSRSAEPVVPSSWRCRTSVFVVTGETLTPPATRGRTCPGSFGKHGPGDHATQNPDLSAPHSWQSVRRLRNNGLHTCTNARGCRAPDAPSQHCRMTRHPALPSRRICRAC